MCPICIEGEPTDREHVRQGDLGGREMTMTCARCNNDLGSKVEAELLDWSDRAIIDVRFDHDGEVPGRRRVPNIHYLEAADGKVLFVPDGDLAPAVEQIMKSGKWNMHYRPP